eukprot:CAMPEP_0173230624 /NCGR_PEP_ID=MMETSP1142-20121109/7876_1 /TAXON_ID=483371 /ORGANISM="non described non described, Strain CCMP2298" /LENGTH=43 /DNA_ID= /DNA_START= /DNA_END= /DNA_ORIENTATION=
MSSPVDPGPNDRSLPQNRAREVSDESRQCLRGNEEQQGTLGCL